MVQEKLSALGTTKYHWVPAKLCCFSKHNFVVVIFWLAYLKPKNPVRSNLHWTVHKNVDIMDIVKDSNIRYGIKALVAYNSELYSEYESK